LLVSPTIAAEEEYEDAGRTSKDGNFGVGGWKQGKDCPGIELFWKFKKDSDYSTAFFRMKNGKIITLDTGMAMFSPDCNCFWLTGYHGGWIRVFETVSGQQIASFEGSYPAWSPDADMIYVAKEGEKYQLWLWSVSKREKMLVYEVTDFCSCNPPGEGVSWFPVRFGSNGDIGWTYPVCNETKGRPPEVGKHLTIDPSTRQIKNTKSGYLYCE